MRTTLLLTAAVVMSMTLEVSAKDKTCVSKNFMLQRSLGDISLFSTNAGLGTNKGAEISFKDDRENDDTIVNVSAAFVWLPNSLVACSPDVTPPGGLPTLGGYAVAPFISFAGTSGTESDTSDVRIGVTSQFQLIAGETFNEFSLSPYFRTDFDGEADITGLQFRWVPYNIDNRINGYIVSGDGPQLGWLIALEAEYLNVDKAGESGLVAGDEYGWIGGVVGASVEFPKLAGFTNSTVFSAELSAHRDVVGNRDAVLGTVAANFFLSETGTTSIRFGYSKGRDFRKFEDIDEFSVNLTVSF